MRETAFTAMVRPALKSPGGKRPHGVGRAVSIGDLRTMARRTLPKGVWGYLEGGAEDEVTLRRNEDAFDSVALVPSVLTDVGKIDMRTTVAGTEIAAPIV